MMTKPSTTDLHQQQGGFSYLLLLIGLSVLALSLLKSTDEVATRHRQQQETELLFRGEQIRAAITAYRAVGNGCYATGFEQLLEDRRGPKPVHHLRQHYLDPLTQKSDWKMILDADGRWLGVTTQGEGIPLRKTGFVKDAAEFAEARTYEDWKFVVKSDLTAPLPAACDK